MKIEFILSEINKLSNLDPLATQGSNSIRYDIIEKNFRIILDMLRDILRKKVNLLL
jgi:hypothetical protein